MSVDVGIRLKDKVIIVTGSSSGIGAACAIGFARAGAHIIVNYSRSEAAAHRVAAQCNDVGAEALVVRGDVAVDQDCRQLAQAALDRWGRIDALVNNAGTTKFVDIADLEGLSADDFHQIYGVNLIGPFQMARACAPALKAGKGGAIVNISSIAALKGAGSSIAYAASKGALNTLTLSLARALAPEVRVNAICPGFIEGDWLREGLGADRYQATRQGYAALSPLADVVHPDDVARAAAWLIGGATRTTGEFVTVDSGFVLGKF